MEKRNSKDIYIHSFSSFFFYLKKKTLKSKRPPFLLLSIPFFDELYVKSFILKLTCIIFFSYLYIFKYYVYFIFGPILIFLEVSKDFNHDFLLTFLDGYMKLKDTKKLKNFGSLPTAIAKNISI